MLTLRKILLCDQLFIIMFITILIISIIRININHKSVYNEDSDHAVGIVTKKIYKDEKLTLYLKGKEILLITYYSKREVNISLGDKVKVDGTFIKPLPNTTKYLFNYKKYLERKRIYYTIEATNITKLKSNKNIYYYIKQRIINHLGNNPYLYTFLLGDKSLIDRDVLRSYQENGISHLFAISGMHITLLATIINKLIGKYTDEEKTFKITTLILIIYLLLVGLSPSILRGVLFYILFSINKIYYFYIKPLNLVLLITSISLLINPFFIFDIGFQYSYLISFALILMSKDLSSNNYLLGLLKVSITSFIVSLPITLCNFYQINLLSILFNLFFVPLISIVIFPLSLIVFIIKPLEPILNILIVFEEKLSIFLSKISIGKLIFKRLPLIIYIIYFLIIFIYLFYRKKYLLYILFFLLSIHYLIPYFDYSDYIKMIDIGQGDSILLHSNNKTILVDTGGNSYSEGEIFYNTTYPLLKSEGIKEIEILIITHGDSDHIGEAYTIINNFKVKSILINANDINYKEQKITANNTKIAYPGTIIKLGDFSFIELNDDLEDENDSSQIYLMRYKDKKILLTGDASVKSEEYVLENYNIGHIDILKVGHHGSHTSTSTNLLDEITPDIALISSGRDNKFNHPHHDVIERLNDYKIKIYNTKEQGTITVNLTKNKIYTDYK